MGVAGRRKARVSGTREGGKGQNGVERRGRNRTVPAGRTVVWGRVTRAPNTLLFSFMLKCKYFDVYRGKQREKTEAKREEKKGETDIPNKGEIPSKEGEKRRKQREREDEETKGFKTLWEGEKGGMNIPNRERKARQRKGEKRRKRREMEDGVKGDKI